MHAVAKSMTTFGIANRSATLCGLQQGDLVQALPHVPEMESAERYYLAWPTSRADYPPLQALRTWLVKAAQDFMPTQAAE